MYQLDPSLNLKLAQWHADVRSVDRCVWAVDRFRGEAEAAGLQQMDRDPSFERGQNFLKDL